MRRRRGRRKEQQEREDAVKLRLLYLTRTVFRLKKLSRGVVGVPFCYVFKADR